MSAPGLIATDLDGTLLRSDGSLGSVTAAALAAAGVAGIPVVVATARPLRWLQRSAWAAYVSHAVLSNGAVVHDSVAGEVISRWPLPPEVLAELCGRITAAVPAARFAVEIDDGLRMWHEPDYPLRSDLGDPRVTAAGLADLVAQPAAKLLIKAPGAAPGTLIPGVTAAVGDLAEVTLSVPTADLAEVAAAGVTKATGLATVAARLRVAPTGAVAFGDMPNDLPMLRWAGHAVAVANAHPEVLATAHEVVASNDQEGVGAWLTAALAGRVPVPPPRAGDSEPAGADHPG